MPNRIKKPKMATLTRQELDEVLAMRDQYIDRAMRAEATIIRLHEEIMQLRIEKELRDIEVGGDQDNE